MRIRSPQPDGDDGSDPAAETAPPGEVSFVVPTWIMVSKFALAALLALVAVVAGDGRQLVIGVVAALAIGVYAARDVVARQRLWADANGFVAVRGYASRQRVDWADVERVRVWRPTKGPRAAAGPMSDTLEIDAGAEIFLFRRYDLGVDPPDALAALDEVRGVKPE